MEGGRSLPHTGRVRAEFRPWIVAFVYMRHVTWRCTAYNYYKIWSGAVVARYHGEKIYIMSPLIWRRLAGLSGASWVGAAAYGAHGLQGLDPIQMKTWDNGNKMHGMHSIMLAMVPTLKLKAPHLSGAFFLAGTAVFSGSCYAAVLTKDRANGRFAPIGGTGLIVAWLTLLL